MAVPSSKRATGEMLQITGQLMSGQVLEERISSSDNVAQLCERFRRQLEVAEGHKGFVVATYEGRPLCMGQPVGDLLPGDAEVLLLKLPNACVLQQVDHQTGQTTALEGEARWQGEMLVLDHESACAQPDWDFRPTPGQDFAVEITVKLNAWPGRDYSGSLVSQHGPGTGWELRCGGAGVQALWTTTVGHNEHLLPLSRPADEFRWWHHMCMVYSAESETMTVYADGEPGKPKKIVGAFKPSERKLEIGRNPYWRDRGVRGKIWRAAVWPHGFPPEVDIAVRAKEMIFDAERSERLAPPK